MWGCAWSKLGWRGRSASRQVCGTPWQPRHAATMIELRSLLTAIRLNVQSHGSCISSDELTAASRDIEYPLRYRFRRRHMSCRSGSRQTRGKPLATSHTHCTQQCCSSLGTLQTVNSCGRNICIHCMSILSRLNLDSIGPALLEQSDTEKQIGYIHFNNTFRCV